MFKVDQLKVVAAAFILLIAYRSLCCFHYLIPCMINWLISSSKKKKKRLEVEKISHSGKVNP